MGNRDLENGVIRTDQQKNDGHVELKNNIELFLGAIKAF